MQGIVLGLILSGILGGIAVRYVGRRRVHATVFTAPSMGLARPSNLGLAYEQLSIPVADHLLRAWFVPAAQARAAVLFFHGQNDALSSLVAAIGRFHQHQISVMVFNYSGHGESTGTPTIERVRADCAAAYAVFATKVGREPTYVMGYSLGAAVLLDAITAQHMDVKAVILASPFSSIRAVALADGLPNALAFLVPDVYNNRRAIAAIAHPLLIVHSETDGTFPLSMAEQLHAANPTTTLRVVAGPGHADVLAAPAVIGDQAEAYWQAVFDFILQQ